MTALWISQTESSPILLLSKGLKALGMKMFLEFHPSVPTHSPPLAE
jgi:hypothetical protein